MERNRTIRLPEPTFLPASRKTNFDLGYKPKYDRMIFFLALLGLTEKQMGQVFNVTEVAINAWRRKYPTFNEAILKGKEEADARVAHSLYQSAVGFKHKRKTVLTNRVKEYDKRGRVVKEWTEPLIVETEEQLPPNVTAALKWLQARQPERWSDRIKIEAKFNVDHNLDLTEFSVEELEMLNKLSEKRRSTNEVEQAEYEEQND
jgi:hypothetical protein